jgi:hypothetical protein
VVKKVGEISNSYFLDLNLMGNFKVKHEILEGEVLD